MASPFSTPDSLLEVARIIATTGMRPPANITAAAAEAADLVSTVSPDKVRHELEAVLQGPHLDLGLQWLHDARVLAVVLPELDATVDFSQEAGRRHKDVWEHTKLVVRQASTKPLVRWAALLHDIGKVKTRVIQTDGKVTFHGHAEVGARMWDPIARRLKFDRDMGRPIRFLILQHLRANAYQASWTDAAVRRFDHEMAEHLDDLLDLSQADVTSRRPGRRQEAAANIESLRARIVALRELDAKLPPLPPGLGTAIMEAFMIPPSKRVGNLRKLCEDAVEAGTLAERQDAAYYVEWLRKQGVADGSSPS